MTTQNIPQNFLQWVVVPDGARLHVFATDSDGLVIGTNAKMLSTCTHLAATTARELAAQLIACADWMERKA